MLHANFMALSSVEPELLLIEVLHAGIGIFAILGSCDFDLDPMTFIYKLDSHPHKLYPQTENELSMSRLLKIIISDIQRLTDRQQNYDNIASWVINQLNHSCSARAKRTLFAAKSARTLAHFIM